MFNSIKADYYRLFRSVGFWGVQAFCINGILLAIFTSQVVSSDNGIFFAIDVVSYNIGMIFIACNVMTSLLLGVDLNYKLYHNNLTTGKTRTQYYFSKSLTIGSLLPLQFILLYILVLSSNLSEPAVIWEPCQLISGDNSQYSLSCRSSVPMLGTALPALST